MARARSFICMSDSECYHQRELCLMKGGLWLKHPINMFCLFAVAEVYLWTLCNSLIVTQYQGPMMYSVILSFSLIVFHNDLVTSCQSPNFQHSNPSSAGLILQLGLLFNQDKITEQSQTLYRHYSLEGVHVWPSNSWTTSKARQSTSMNSKLQCYIHLSGLGAIHHHSNCNVPAPPWVSMLGKTEAVRISSDGWIMEVYCFDGRHWCWPQNTPRSPGSAVSHIATGTLLSTSCLQSSQNKQEKFPL